MTKRKPRTSEKRAKRAKRRKQAKGEEKSGVTRLRSDYTLGGGEELMTWCRIAHRVAMEPQSQVHHAPTSATAPEAPATTEPVPLRPQFFSCFRGSYEPPYADGFTSTPPLEAGPPTFTSGPAQFVSVDPEAGFIEIAAQIDGNDIRAESYALPSTGAFRIRIPDAVVIAPAFTLPRTARSGYFRASAECFVKGSSVIYQREGELRKIGWTESQLRLFVKAISDVPGDWSYNDLIVFWHRVGYGTADPVRQINNTPYLVPGNPVFLSGGHSIKVQVGAVLDVAAFFESTFRASATFSRYPLNAPLHGGIQVKKVIVEFCEELPLKGERANEA